MAAIVSGCGQDAAEVALAAYQHLEQRLVAKQEQPLVSFIGQAGKQGRHSSCVLPSSGPTSVA